MTPVRGFTAASAVEVLKVALSEYEASIEDGKFAKPVEYQDSRGFVWQAERMIEGAAAELAKADAEALAKIRARPRRAQDRLARADAAAGTRSWSRARCRP